MGRHFFKGKNHGRLSSLDRILHPCVRDRDVQRAVWPAGFYRRKKTEDHIYPLVAINDYGSFVASAALIDIARKTAGKIVQLRISEKAVSGSDCDVLPMVLGIEM